MKKLLFSSAFLLVLFACNDEPKLNKQEESAVESQLNADQKAMDSLEAAIKMQMEELDADSAGLDSL